jgi:hypothetical protein
MRPDDRVVSVTAVALPPCVMKLCPLFAAALRCCCLHRSGSVYGTSTVSFELLAAYCQCSSANYYMLSL